MNLTSILAALSWDPIVRIHLGPISISPHGLGTALGFLAGALLMRTAARRIGVNDEQLHRILTRGLIGGIVGARLAYVANHAGDYDNLFEVLAVWEGGISLLGGITGGILAALPMVRRDRLPVLRLLDAAAPGLALGIFIGRIGDLIVADHLGKPTDFPLGYTCPAGDAASPCAAAVGQAVHQPALYDMASAAVLLVVLLKLRRRTRDPGFLILTFGAWYGTARFVEDFFRLDETHGTGLSGSQWFAATVAVGCTAALVIRRRRRSPPTPPQEHHDALT